MSSSNSENPQTATFFAFGGAAASIAFTAIGAAYGTAKSGNGISIVATRKPALIMKAIIPVVMAGKILKFSFTCLATEV